jgi:hypothetical protein
MTTESTGIRLGEKTNAFNFLIEDPSRDKYYLRLGLFMQNNDESAPEFTARKQERHWPRVSTSITIYCRQWTLVQSEWFVGSNPINKETKNALMDGSRTAGDTGILGRLAHGC